MAGLEPEGKSLPEAMAAIKAQQVQMRRHLDSDQLMDGLKAASMMLGELRTSSLTPKDYYQLYMAVFDSLRYLSTHLYDIHTQGRHHLADVYELVQYSSACVSRLYLMITVGSVYMSVPDAPVQEIMRDILEMSRGVQNPMRGLFLRHYLSGQTRDYLPTGTAPGPQGCLEDSIDFILTNFVEMNKLWVRLQHQGHSRERDRREAERKELRILVGTNLVRLSSLEGVSLDIYTEVILTKILEQVVNCKDVIAQEYLMEVIIQVFPDEFHLRTLGPFLRATAQLHPAVNIKGIVIALIDRLAAHATEVEEGKSKNDVASQTKALRNIEMSDKTQVSDEKTKEIEEDSKIPELGNKTIPTDIHLFEIFWTQVVQLVKARPDISLHDVIALMVSMVNLSLSCYKERMEYVDQVLEYASMKVTEFTDSPEIHSSTTTQQFLSLLLTPAKTYNNPLQLLKLQAYRQLLWMQPFSSRRTIAHAIIETMLRNDVLIGDPTSLRGIFDLCHVLIKDTPVVGTTSSATKRPAHNVMEMEDEQGWMARTVHLLRSDDIETQYQLLLTAKSLFFEGGERMKYTLPSLAYAGVNLVKRLHQRREVEVDYDSRIQLYFKFIHQTISMLYHKVESSEICLRLFLAAARAADRTEQEELCYEFFVQSFTIYEESISESRSQLIAIISIMKSLQSSSVFGAENYDTLVSKASVHSTRLLKKNHQVQSILYGSHMWWQRLPEEGETPQNAPIRSGKKIMEQLKKSLRIASACIEEAITVQLYVLCLDHYLFYFKEGVPEVEAKYIESLVELISTNLDTITSSEIAAVSLTAAAPGATDVYPSPDAIYKHFRNTLIHIRDSQSASDADLRWAQIDIDKTLVKYKLLRM